MNNPVEIHSGCPWGCASVRAAVASLGPLVDDVVAVADTAGRGKATQAARQLPHPRDNATRGPAAGITALGPKLSTYAQGNPQKLSTGVDTGPAASREHGKIASSGGQIRFATVNYTLVSY